MEKLKMHSPDFTEENIAKLAELFPNCVTEAQDENGQMKKSIDFDQLRQELSNHIVEGPQERYHLNWPGKREALLTANAPIAKTLRPCREESVDFDTTKNLFIEGDNLEALKLLQETYLGKVKMIYIDPPYNTGKDFIYEDDFAEGIDEFMIRSNQKDEFGNRMIANTESNGRIHSDWLSMMYSRLKLSHNFMSDDGIIFISINHKELANLRKICDEIFGEANMLCLFAWRTDGNFDNQAKFKYCHEYIIAYAKQEDAFPHPLVVDPNTPKESKIYRSEIRNTIVKNGTKNPPSKITLPVDFPSSFESGDIKTRTDSWPHFLGDAKVESSRLIQVVDVYSGWSSKDLLMEFIGNGCHGIKDAKGQLTTFELTATGAIEAVKERGDPSHVISLLSGLGGPQRATTEVQETGIIFDDYPKPIDLIKYLITMNRGDDYVVLDFFAGSATTAHSAMQLNAEDGGSRKFIMVQLPEKCSDKSEAFKSGYKTIADISKERIRRAGKKIKEKNADNEGIDQLDIGFRVLKVDTSNMTDVYYSPDEFKHDDLFSQVDNIREDRSAEDLLFQVLLDWGVDLTLPIHKKTIQGKTVFFVDENALVACFDTDVGEALVRELAQFRSYDMPIRKIIFRDNGFASDAVKINVEQIFKQLSPGTEVKSI